MKLIHVRVYPHEKLDVQPNISIEEVSKIKFRERDARDRITEELEKAGLELYKDYIIIVSYGPLRLYSYHSTSIQSLASPSPMRRKEACRYS